MNDIFIIENGKAKRISEKQRKKIMKQNRKIQKKAQKDIKAFCDIIFLFKGL